ncbi:MAG: hypothetical protein LUG12_10350 [Erysipelotrichaceae bacterium]|nr:hypothetical protein [Erysipelotrichaceae bacterium]
MISRKTAKEERIKIVKYCIEHNSNYDETAEYFDVSFQNVYIIGLRIFPLMV